MKKHIILTSIPAVLLPLSAWAQSPTASGSAAVQSIQSGSPAPPLVSPGPGHFHEHDNGPKQPVTFLGVETSEVPRVLSAQMGLPEGFGVVVDYVVPNSAAANAGVQRSDIIRLLNDQRIVGPVQLGRLIRSFPDGGSIELTLLRQGKEMKVNVKLGRKEVSARHDHGFEQQWNFEDLENLKDFKGPDMSEVRDAVTAAVAQAKAEARRAGEEARRAARNLRIVTADDGSMKSTRIDLGNATITLSDDQGELKVENKDGHRTLTAKDAKGDVLFSGPIDTSEQRGKIPANVRERFEKLENDQLAPVPPVPPMPPQPPQAPESPDSNESAHLHDARAEQAVFHPAARTGWRRSTIIL
jgi:hypothetical protein